MHFLLGVFLMTVIVLASVINLNRINGLCLFRYTLHVLDIYLKWFSFAPFRQVEERHNKHTPVANILSLTWFPLHFMYNYIVII